MNQELGSMLCAKESSQSTIDRQIDVYNEEVKRYYDLVEMLVAKLQPVVSNEPKNEPTDFPSINETTNCAIANLLLSLNKDIKKNNRNLSDLIKTIDL